MPTVRRSSWPDIGWRLLLGGVVSGFIACTTSGQGTNTSVMDTTCNDYASVVCAKLATCGAESLTRRYADEQTCIARQKANCVEALAAPSTGRTTASVKDCETAYPSASCDDILAGNPPAVCLGPSHPGLRANGSVCALPAQCQSGYCDVPRGSACGTCVAAGPKPGDPCPSTCGPLQYCDPTSNLCAAYVVAGGPCDTTGRFCMPGLVCTGDVNGATGACVAPVAMGAACDISTVTGPPCSLEDGDVCASKICTKAPNANPGGTCGPTKPTTTLCLAGAKCDAANGATGICQGLVADGAACDTGNDQSCLPLADCVGSATGSTVMGVCTIRSASACQ